MSSAPIIVSKRFDHHGCRSGYDRLTAFIPEATIIRPAVDPSHGRWFGRVADKLVRRKSPLCHYGLTDLIVEWRVARAAGGKHRIVHYLYAEDQFAWAPRFRGLRNAVIVGTVHQPPEWTWYVVRSHRHWSRLNGIITMAATQNPAQRSYAPDADVRTIPHGVDTDFFTPAPRHESSNTVLIVGQWLRDFKSAATAVSAFRLAGGQATFSYVGPESGTAALDGAGIRRHGRVSDEQLRDLYRNSALVWLPLIDATANNALLESLACGTPVLAPELPGLTEYARHGGVRLHSGGASNATSDLLQLLCDDSERAALRADAASAAERFSWTTVTQTVKAYYRDLAGD